ncbi:MAG: 5'-nucleotidase C-terminal domain-containing protein, partial [Prevotella sp.]|nr:5'-nucleotidase C-terminal domain-containing protein [Prevotella sp.]
IASRKGEGVSHGVEMTIAPDGKLLKVRLNGEEIRDDRTYRIATLDYLAQGNDGLLAFQDGTDLVSPQDAANNVRFIIMDYFRAAKAKGKAVDSKVEGRIIVQP